MRKSLRFTILFFVFAVGVPSTVHAFGLEAAVGGWNQSPQGKISFRPQVADDIIDFENDLKYDAETRFSGRVKLDMPLIIPNVYLMATPMEFDGTGLKTVDFNFGDFQFQQNIDFFSKITLDHYDLALYYGIPFLETVTLGMLNVDVGINVRLIAFKAHISQSATGLEESESFTLPVPMVFLAAQLEPVEKIALEAEARGISYSGNQIFSLIGRVRLKVFGPVFAAGGYRYDKIKFDEDDIEIDAEFSGPFLEVGLVF